MKLRLVKTYTNGFTGLTWRTYQDPHGCEASVCVQPFFSRRKTAAQCRAEAAAEITEDHRRRRGL